MSTNIQLCQQFADALTTKEHFSQAAMEKAGYCLLDFLTCAFSTHHFSWVQQAQQVAINNSGTESGGAIILGTSAQVSMQDAVFVNAVAGHSLVRDDMHLGSVSHLGVAVIPTALALAAFKSVSGKQLLEAIICGYEAGAKLGALLMDVETAKKIRPTGLIGAFTAAATAARLLGLDAEETGNALGFSSNYITGLNEWADWGSDDMYFHPGIAARNGLTATQLAQAGAVAAAGSLDGKAGLFAAFNKPVPSLPGLPFSDSEEILQVFFKQVPACNYAQTAAQVAQRAALRTDFRTEAITQIDVNVPHAAASYPGCDYAGPFESILQARMSIQFNVASALLHKDFSDSHYQDYGNQQILNIVNKIKLATDDNLSAAYPAGQGANISIAMDDSIIAEHLDDVIAADFSEVTERFFAACEAVFDTASCQALHETITNLDSDLDAQVLIQLLTKH